jgi:hypothetical protein
MIQPPAFRIEPTSDGRGFILHFPYAQQRASSRNFRLLFMLAAALGWRPQQ